ncbi:restriction endonuclease subunit S [Escherichia coli]|uniref:restriction endonuclease subunit S n=1 Tax=Escherichia coli TaxID=562 RepID=UPI000DA29029|nr:restriction endonuclease subunit S [Escherichia coli]EFD4871645.1 restriction endonuclease subunit S [Escherichia coli]EFE7988858.1 restriction endonuclease subunit S [Escherichia coli]EFH7924585.1 restriction endonuclease subunit S [Escherichia coli]EFJ3101657.1 restriction endonuclease subunit S [Escherichia coli]EFN4810562.1 restriction endonuclease subunit S [Escherichia coli]
MDFDEYSFADLLSNIVDNRGKTCPVEDKGFPLIATNCIKDDSLYPVFEKVRFVSDDTYKNWFRGHPNAGDIIFVCKGSPGRVAWVKEPVSFCIAQDMVAIRADQRLVDPMFLFSLLRSEQVINKINNMHVGTLIPHFKKGDFKNLYLSIPRNLKIQRAIGLFYFSLSEKIEKNKEINQTLEQMAQALFKSWFVDFDPVKAKMAVLDAGGSQADATLAAMTAISGKDADALAVFEREHPEQYAELKATAELFPSAMQESEGRDIPKGWAVVKTEELTSKIGMGPFGSNIKVSTFVDEGIPIISGQHLKESILNDGENNFVTLEHADKLKSSNVFSEDIIFTHAGSIGQVSIIPEFSEYDRYVISQRQFFLRADKKLISPYYLLYFFRSRTGQHLLLSNASQVGVPSIARPSSHLKNIELVAPDFKLVKKFEDHCKTIINGVVQRKKQTVLLKNIRDTLLPKLLSGEITLPEAEQAVSEAENV